MSDSLIWNFHLATGPEKVIVQIQFQVLKLVNLISIQKVYLIRIHKRSFSTLKYLVKKTSTYKAFMI